MAKASSYANVTSLAANTRLFATHTANGVVNNYNVTVSVLFASNAAPKLINHRSDTPANSTAATCLPGETWSDGTYLYFATSNNVCKRASLSTF